MENKKQDSKWNVWIPLLLPLLAIALIYPTISGETPEQQFIKGLLVGIGAGLILANIYFYFAHWRRFQS